MEKIKVVLIGYGYWGPNLARNFFLNSNFQLIAVIDQEESRRNLAKSLYGVPTYSSYLDLEDFLDIDLAVICTRPSSHKSLAIHFIKKKVSVLVTKPCGLSSTEAHAISSLAKDFGVKAFSDFTYHYSPFIKFLESNQKAAQIISEMREYSSYRTSLGIVQSDVDVLADLAVHDIYILLLLKHSLPKSVSCLRTNSTNDSQMHAAFITLKWEEGFIAAIHVSWNSPKKVRLISITSRDHGIILEEMNPEAPIQLVEFSPDSSDYSDLTAEERYSRNVSFTMGKLEIPNIEVYEALALEVDTIAMVLKSPESRFITPDAESAANVWKVVEALRESNRLGGKAQHV